MSESKRSQKHKQKSGHGSLTKAGKVRSQTPKLVGANRRSTIPKVKKHKAYEKLFIRKRKPGQNYQRVTRY